MLIQYRYLSITYPHTQRVKCWCTIYIAFMCWDETMPGILHAWQQHKICDALQTEKCKLVLCLLYENMSPEVKAKYDCPLVVGSPRIVSEDIISIIMPLPVMSQCLCGCAVGVGGLGGWDMFTPQRVSPSQPTYRIFLPGIHSKKTYRWLTSFLILPTFQIVALLF